LLVIVPDRLSQIIEKGECQPNYYNPGELFDDVHLLLMNDDKPSLAALQLMVGRAELHLHNYPDDLNLVARHHGLTTPFRLRKWARGGVEIARAIKPDLIRCHGIDWNAYLASRINAELGIPYAVSVHINPDENPVRRFKGADLSAEQRRQNAFYEYLEHAAVKRARLIMPVYQPILPYLERKGARQVEVCYNILDGGSLSEKTDYTLADPPQLLYVGRVFGEKNPANIIHAVAGMPGMRYTIVGDGPLRPSLEELVRDLDVQDRITFRPAIGNAELCRMLPTFDLFVIHTEHFEISKSVLEALLTGLPIIMNQRKGAPVPELQGGIVRLVPDTTEAYAAAIQELVRDHDARKALGRKAYREASTCYAPAVTERKVVRIYEDILEAHHG
ncbi:MAG: glycosyltransferase family 4 protein, partial [Geminicoccaceae bacterium]